jgi:hypothetical protein
MVKSAACMRKLQNSSVSEAPSSSHTFGIVCCSDASADACTTDLPYLPTVRTCADKPQVRTSSPSARFLGVERPWADRPWLWRHFSPTHFGLLLTCTADHRPCIYSSSVIVDNGGMYIGAHVISRAVGRFCRESSGILFLLDRRGIYRRPLP